MKAILLRRTGGPLVIRSAAQASAHFAMLAPLGMVISYGRLDGPPDADLLTAMRTNSAVSPALRFFTIHSFDDRPDIRAATMKTLLSDLAADRIRPLVHHRLPLADAARAHELLESGNESASCC